MCMCVCVWSPPKTTKQKQICIPNFVLLTTKEKRQINNLFFPLLMALSTHTLFFFCVFFFLFIRCSFCLIASNPPPQTHKDMYIVRPNNTHTTTSLPKQNENKNLKLFSPLFRYNQSEVRWNISFWAPGCNRGRSFVSGRINVFEN